MSSFTSVYGVCWKVDKGGSEYKRQYALSKKSLEDFALRSQTSVTIDQLCAGVLPCSSYLTDHIRSACRSVFCLAGWVGRLPTCLQWCHGTWSITLGNSLGTRRRGSEGRRKALVDWGSLVCMRDGRQCIKRWQLSHSFLNKSGETLAGCALTLIIHLNNCCRSLQVEGAAAKQAAMGLGNMKTDVALLDFSFVNV